MNITDNVMYECFDRFIFRCPILPCESQSLDILQSPLFRESIFLASPALYETLTANLLNGSETSRQVEASEIDLKNPKIAISAFKYITRMSSRCTPFGLFAACGVGKTSEHSAISLNGLESFRTTTRLDMDYLCALSRYLGDLPEVADRLSYYPNSSLYQLFNAYRYVEYNYIFARRRHFLSEVPFSPEIEKILQTARTGASKEVLADTIVGNEVEPDEAKNFVQQLIDNQLLVSELDPCITGDDILSRLHQKLDSLKTAADICSIISTIREKLKKIDDQKPGRNPLLYEEIEYEVQKLPVKFERKYLFQSDTTVRPLTATLGKNVIQLVKDGLDAINRLTFRWENTAMKSFKENFYKRYEEEEIPLVEALDSDIGIGFDALTPGNTDLNPLIDRIVQGHSDKGSGTNTYRKSDLFLFEKFLEARRLHIKEIVITEEELKPFPANWDDLASTISTNIEVLDTGNGINPVIMMRGAGNSSAANMVSRFCHAHEDIREYVSAVIEMENSLLPDTKILAEVAHLPQSRTGNILFRPALRKYEIPYLANSTVPEEYKLLISDLMVSVPAGKTIRLRSKRLDKQVVPRLTTAHIYYADSLPIYHFLGALQMEGLKGNLQFDWGPLVGQRKFLPRVRYKNVILSPAIWIVKASLASEVLPITDNHFHDRTLKFKKDKGLPDKVLLVEGDNKLLIDFSNLLSTQLLFSKAKDRDMVLEEYLFNKDHSLITSDGMAHNNQIVLGLYKKKRIGNKTEVYHR